MMTRVDSRKYSGSLKGFLMKLSYVIIILSSLTGCTATMSGMAQDSKSAIHTATNMANQNRDAIDQAATQTGELLKKSGNLIGKGMQATGQLLQEMTAE